MADSESKNNETMQLPYSPGENSIDESIYTSVNEKKIKRDETIFRLLNSGCAKYILLFIILCIGGILASIFAR